MPSSTCSANGTVEGLSLLGATVDFENGQAGLIWTAVAQVSQLQDSGLLTPLLRTGLSPFMHAAVELALAAIVTPEENATKLVQTACAELEQARRVLGSVERDLVDVPLSPETALHWQRRLARQAVRTFQAFSREREKVRALPDDGGVYAPYPTTLAATLQEPDASKLWLIEQLWQRSGTGIIGGGAKGAKTWLALDLALSVASGTPALDRFAVHRSGGVIYVNAEGGEGYVKQRLHALCVHRGLSLDSLPYPFDVIPHAIRIDTPDGLGRLKATVQARGPVLLVLDPLVRLHRLDENSAASVSGLLSNLTELQQSQDLAIILVHHATKQGVRSREMGGQDFRGSSDFHAWGDSNVFVKKRGQNRFVFSAEHRAAPATEKWTLQATLDDHPRLQIVDESSEDVAESSRASDDERVDSDILHLLHRGPQSIAEVRNAVKGSNARISEAMMRLEAQKKISKAGRRWTVINGSGPRPRSL